MSHGDNWVDDHHGILLLRNVSHDDNWDDNHHGTLLLSNNSGGEIGDIPITIVDLHHEIGDIHITIVDLHHGTLVTSILQWLICIEPFIYFISSASIFFMMQMMWSTRPVRC